ncbi:hypothetical protein GBA52_004454 [Prunus armeniaca]|nr:hypothetical protein GBA52_004454 [Prunus armeniaca]
MQEGLTDIMVIVLAHISHTCSGSFPIIATTNAAYLHQLDNKESIVFEREASIEEAQNQENDIVKQEERGKEPCQASGSLSLRLDKIIAGGGGQFWALIEKLIKEKKLLVQEMLATWLAYHGCSVVMAAGSTFFEQLSNLGNPFTGSNPEVFFYCIRSISKSLSRTIPKKWKSSSATTWVRIG